MKPGDVFNPHNLFTGVFVPEALVKHGKLSPGSKLTYGRLARFAGKDGRCYPSLATLGKELGVSRDQARRYLRELGSADLIKITLRTTVSGDPDTSQVLFLWHVLFEAEGVVAEMPPGVVAEMLPPPSKNAPTVVADLRGGVVADLLPKESQGKRVKEENNSFDRWFAEFWQLYPRKVGKLDALKAAKSKAKTEALQTEILAGLRAHVPEYQSRERNFIPHPATFLNKGYWADEPELVRSDSTNGRPPDRWETRARRRDETFIELMTEGVGNAIHPKGPRTGKQPSGDVQLLSE